MLKLLIFAAIVLMALPAYGAEWSYQGETGPGLWGQLNPHYSACTSGTLQSPIHIRRARITNLTELVFDDRSGPVTIENTGYTAKVKAPRDSYLTVGTDKYALQQFHFHVPSEASIEGRRYAAGVHLVHANEKGALAVVGVLFEEGAANELIESLWAALPLDARTQTQGRVPVDPARLLPAIRDYFTYVGSLTTPPCSEGLRWFVTDQPLSISISQWSWVWRALCCWFGA